MDNCPAFRIGFLQFLERSRCLLGVRRADAEPLGAVISTEKVVDPRRRLPEFPIAGRHDIFADLVFFVLRLQPQIRPHPDTQLFLRIHFAPSLVTSAARGVALVLGALGYGTQIRSVEQGAIAAILAIVQRRFAAALEEMKSPIPASR